MPTMDRVLCTCGRYFGSSASMDTHLKHKKNHTDLVDPCGLVHETTALLVAHLLECHEYCATCKKHFKNTPMLESHIFGQHTKRTVECVGKKCIRMFKDMTSLIQHLESGFCNSGTTRITVNRVVVRLDAHSVITDPNRLIAVPEGYEAPETTPPLATESSWNGSCYACSLCPLTSRSLKGLNTHLQSASHDAAIYRCPNFDACGRKFKALSMLCGHVRTNRCGVMQLQYAKETVESLTTGLKTLRI